MQRSSTTPDARMQSRKPLLKPKLPPTRRLVSEQIANFSGFIDRAEKRLVRRATVGAGSVGGGGAGLARPENVAPHLLTRQVLVNTLCSVVQRRVSIFRTIVHGVSLSCVSPPCDIVVSEPLVLGAHSLFTTTMIALSHSSFRSVVSLVFFLLLICSFHNTRKRH